jgi:hypothetical protein
VSNEIIKKGVKNNKNTINLFKTVNDTDLKDDINIINKKYRIGKRIDCKRLKIVESII